MQTRTKGPPIQIYPEKCAGCLVCELRCSLRFEKAFNPAKAAIRVRRLVGEANEYDVAFTDKCDNCGICARYCLYEALIQEKKAAAGKS